MKLRRRGHINELEAPGDYTIVAGDFPMPDGVRHVRSIVFACFDCGRPMSLYRNHVVNVETLDVTPSVVCPYNEAGDVPKCAGHYFIRGGARA